tara:strand:+ start:58 stop:393 length:336 start_codon:yes stop_codon:yes gene_type:complete
MELYGGATNEQYIDNLLKQTYSTLRPILINEKFQDSINKCVNISLEDNDKDLEDLVSKCKKYSFITFFKDLYLIPKNIDYVASYLVVVLILLIVIIFMLVVIAYNLLFSQN